MILLQNHGLKVGKVLKRGDGRDIIWTWMSFKDNRSGEWHDIGAKAFVPHSAITGLEVGDRVRVDGTMFHTRSAADDGTVFEAWNIMVESVLEHKPKTIQSAPSSGSAMDDVPF